MSAGQVRYLDLNLGVDHVFRLYCRARRRIPSEELAVNAIEFIEVVCVIEPDRGLHHVLERATGQCKCVSDIFHRLARVSFYRPCDDVAVFVSCYLAGHKHKAAGLRRQ